MSKSAGEIFYSMGSALGLPDTDPAMEAIKNNKELFTTTSTALEDAYSKEFITVTAAKSNGEIKKHYNGLALGTIENKLDEYMDEFGFDDTVKSEIKKQDSTYKRNEALIRKLKALGEKASNTEPGKEKTKLLEEIQALNGKLAENEKTFKESLQAEANKWQGEFSSMVMEAKLTERPLIDSINGKDPIPRSLVLNTAKGFIEEEAKKKGAKIVYDHDRKGFNLVQASNPELPYMENHKAVSFDEFRDSVLANNKLIKVTATATPKFSPSNTTTTAEPQKESPRTQEIREKVDRALDNLRNAPSPVV